MESLITTNSNSKTDELLTNIGKYLGTTQFWISLAIVVVAIVLWRVYKRVRRKWQEKNGNHMSTASHVIFDIVRFAFFFLLIIVLLQVNGVNVTALLTGLSVVSVIVGFALQDFLKDIIMGVHILTDKFFEVGDVVRYNDYEGVVISFNVRTTKLKLVTYNEIFTISNRNISEIQVLSDMFDLDIDLPYFIDAKTIHDAMRQIEKDAHELEGIKKCVYKGTERFNESSITYRLRYFTNPDSRRFDVRRRLVTLVQDSLNKAGIPFPYNHLDVEIVNKDNQ